jgi:acylphosphatase
MMHCCYQFIVTGRVQGVFFRASTRDEASRLGLSGWVRNLNAGDVELVACGDSSKIEKLKEWLWQGPRFARVTEVRAECLSETSVEARMGFEIRSDG